MSPLKKSLLIVSSIVFLLVAILVVLAVYTSAWRVFFPSTEHDVRPPQLPASLNSPAILLFSKTNSFRHVDGIEAGSGVIREIAKSRGWQLFATENGAVFNDSDLDRFNVVVFLNATGDMLSLDQERTFQNWLEAGGGWLGIHAAGDGSHQAWTWYMENLIGADFIAHIMGPQFQQARLMREEPDHPVVQRLPGAWRHTDEWYSWETSPRLNGFTILVTVDETSYSPAVKFLGMEKDLRMGDHPVVWSNCVGRGRSIYTAMGHSAEAFENREFRLLLEDSLDWVMRAKKSACQ